MEIQNRENHSKKAPSSYYTAILLGLVVIVFVIMHIDHYLTAMNGLLIPVLFISLSVGLIFIGYYSRAFALKAQDRAIRAEENLRHFALTGSLLDKKLTIQQVIALRFASDEEFVDLAKMASENNLSNKEIKKEIKNWRADYYRV